jgi:A/G-specific adenine glycosylase
MHQAARRIVGDGQFPRDLQEWEQLPGVGRYTAAAIASICYNQACAVVDGNVERVLQRVLPADAGDLWERAAELLSRRRPGNFNQALMELGALLCTPRAPRCPQCPIRRLCAAFEAGTVRLPNRPGCQQRAQLAYALTVADGKVLLVQRAGGQSVMPGMWELPQIPLLPPETPARETFVLKHAIMNTDYIVQVVRQNLDRPEPGRRPGARWFSAQRAARLPLTGLARKALMQAGIL